MRRKNTIERNLFQRHFENRYGSHIWALFLKESVEYRGVPTRLLSLTFNAGITFQKAKVERQHLQISFLFVDGVISVWGIDIQLQIGTRSLQATLLQRRHHGSVDFGAENESQE